MMPDIGILGTVEQGADLVPLPAVPTLPTLSAPLHAQVREYIRASKAENTLRGYQADWRDFCAWCDAHGLRSIPAAAMP
jgi:hypothetical protein